MRKPNKREGILIAVMAAVAVYAFSLDAGVRNKRRLNDAFREGARQTLPRPSTGRIQIASPHAGAGVAGIYDRWSLDPFDRPFTRVPDGPARGLDDDGAHRPAPLVLQGVMVARGARAAMINREIYAEGDTVGRYIVEAIDGHGAVLRSAIDGSRVHLKVE